MPHTHSVQLRGGLSTIGGGAGVVLGAAVVDAVVVLGGAGVVGSNVVLVLDTVVGIAVVGCGAGGNSVVLVLVLVLVKPSGDVVVVAPNPPNIFGRLGSSESTHCMKVFCD